MIEGGSPNQLIRMGVTKNTVPIGTELARRRLSGQGRERTRPSAANFVLADGTAAVPRRLRRQHRRAGEIAASIARGRQPPRGAEDARQHRRASAGRCWCSAGSGETSRPASATARTAQRPVAELRPRPRRHAPPLQQLQPGVERDLAERHHHAHVRQARDLGVAGDRGSARSPPASACCPAARSGPRPRCRRRASVRPSSRCCDVAHGWRSRCAWSAVIRKSPEPPTPSPVKTRPVRLAPCAAGARPTISTRAPRVAEARHRPAPVDLVAVGALLLARDARAVVAQATAAFA